MMVDATNGCISSFPFFVSSERKKQYVMVPVRWLVSTSQSDRAEIVDELWLVSMSQFVQPELYASD